MPCLVGCVNNYICGGLRESVNADSPAPWVEVRFEPTGPPSSAGTNPGTRQSRYAWNSVSANGGSGTASAAVAATTVSVGNRSSPSLGNTAVIKSFQFGASSGNGCVIEIYDEQGSSFQVFMERLNKSLVRASSEYRMKVQWGWTASNCNAGGYFPTSPICTFLPQNITAAYDHGKIKFTIQGNDMMQAVFQSRNDQIVGNDRQRLPLKEAIRKMFRENSPAVTSVRFLRVTNGRNTQEWGFKPSNGGFQGPRTVWEGDQQNALATAVKWIAPFTTDTGKGIVPAWNCINNNPELIFWEDTHPLCNEGVNACGRTIGTYIVNGGHCSPVLGFNPSVQWNFSMAGRAGGNTGSAGSAEAITMPGQCNINASGTQTTVAPSRYAWETGGGPRTMTRDQAIAAAAHERANMGYRPIEAELRIQGDPSLADPIFLKGRMISLIVINPFHLTGTSCDTWLSQPECNSAFSNKAWMIKGVSHDIREGSYVTTISISLATPGSTIDRGQPVGGAGSGGWTPTNT